ncbi:21 kDa protein [Spatholobus suberectus]|nr:21 kDa protein [Spatholobus suberectus]
MPKSHIVGAWTSSSPRASPLAPLLHVFKAFQGMPAQFAKAERLLAITALYVSVSRTRSCASFVKVMGSAKGMKPIEHNVVQDCIELMDDSVDRLSQSIRELGLLGKAEGKDFAWHMSNVQTWVSAAMTNQKTCLDEVDGPHVDANLKDAIRPRVVDVSQVTSNALALVNRFASKNRTIAQTKMP